MEINYEHLAVRHAVDASHGRFNSITIAHNEARATEGHMLLSIQRTDEEECDPIAIPISAVDRFRKLKVNALIENGTIRYPGGQMAFDPGCCPAPASALVTPNGKNQETLRTVTLDRKLMAKVMDAAREAKVDKLTIEMYDEKTPAVFRGKTGSGLNFLGLIMPIRND